MQGSLGFHSPVAFLAHSEPVHPSGVVLGACSGSVVLNPLLPKLVVLLQLPPLLSFPPLPSLPAGSPTCVPRPNLREMSEPVPPSHLGTMVSCPKIFRGTNIIFPFEDRYKLKRCSLAFLLNVLIHLHMVRSQDGG